MNKIFVWCFALLMLVVSCRQGRVATTAFEGDTLRLKYAENIVIVRDSAVTMVELRNPWGEGVLHRYWLVSKNADFSPSEGTVNGGTPSLQQRRINERGEIRD